jgi:cyclic pyranopterin phosphate synthase
MRISATGQLHTCLFSEEGLDARYLMQSSDQQPLLEKWLVTQAYNKKATHGLHEQNTGATSHLAMLGG